MQRNAWDVNKQNESEAQVNFQFSDWLYNHLQS